MNSAPGLTREWLSTYMYEGVDDPWLFKRIEGILSQFDVTRSQILETINMLVSYYYTYTSTITLLIQSAGRKRGSPYIRIQFFSVGSKLVQREMVRIIILSHKSLP